MNNEKETNRISEEELLTETVTGAQAAQDLVLADDTDETAAGPSILMFDAEETEEEFEKHIREEEDAIAAMGEDAGPPAKYGRRAAKKAGGLFPHKGDSAGEKLRKCVFLLALLALLGSGVYLLYDMVYLPAMNEKTYDQVADLYNPDNPVEVPEEYENITTVELSDRIYQTMAQDLGPELVSDDET